MKALIPIRKNYFMIKLSIEMPWMVGQLSRFSDYLKHQTLKIVGRGNKGQDFTLFVGLIKVFIVVGANGREGRFP